VPVKAVTKPVVKAKPTPKKKAHPDKVPKSKVKPVPVAKPILSKENKSPVADRVVNQAVVPQPLEGSPRERIEKLFTIGVQSPGVAQAILDIKKKSKKSWEALNVSSDGADRVLELTKIKKE
jgi:hypothetical protein